MGIYTRQGSTELDERIAADMARITDRIASISLAGVLIGGYGRGEGTPFIHHGGSQAPFNDYDIVVVVDKFARPLREKLQSTERQLTREMGLAVELCPYRKACLHRCEFSLLNYEMKHGHKVIWGDANILDAMPDFQHNAIPLSEGTRLLLNRGKLLLDTMQRLEKPEPLDEKERIQHIKFLHKVLLALGDCVLLAERKYDLFYHIKRERISTIGTVPDRDFVINGYLKAIELKEWGDFHSMEKYDISGEFNIIREVFLRFLPWYRSLHSGNEYSAFKAIALNLKWNKRLSATSPREQLYDALPGLLQGHAPIPIEHFYKLQRRFS